MTRRTLLPVLLVAFLASTLPSAVRADGPMPGQPRPTGSNKTPESSEVFVTSAPSGVTIFISLTSTRPGRPGIPSASEVVAGPVTPVCTAAPLNLGNSTPGWIGEGLLLNPGTTPWGVSCTDGSFTIAWVPVDAAGPPDVVVADPGEAPVDPAELAASVLGVVPLPDVMLGASPAVGLVALPSWFWVDGYGGEHLTGSRTLGAITVDVEVAPREYRWDFGDGGRLTTTSLGRRYPAESDVQHVYEASAPSARGFSLRLEIEWDARYRVNGGAWVPLAPVIRGYRQDYPVTQVQSVLTSR